MQKLKKVAAVAVMVSGLGMVGSGVAGASDDPFFIDNVQVQKCEQSFEAGAVHAPIHTGPFGGDFTSNTGNFCAQANIED